MIRRHLSLILMGVLLLPATVILDRCSGDSKKKIDTKETTKSTKQTTNKPREKEKQNLAKNQTISKLYGNYKFSIADYGDIVEDKDVSKGGWHWEEPNVSFLSINKDAFSISIGCSTFNGKHTIQQINDNEYIATINSVSIKKPQAQCKANTIEAEKQVLSKVFAKNNEVWYSAKNTLGIIVRYDGRTKYWSALAKK